MSSKVINTVAIGLVGLAAALILWKNHLPGSSGQTVHLLNVSYDPTREVYQEINQKFQTEYHQGTGNNLVIEQSHGGSARQARAVWEGLAADVVTLALPSDIQSLEKRGLVDANWVSKFPNDSQPYSSTIVFVVRKNNPKNIKDWPDLIQSGVEVVTPDPATSGNGKLSFLGAWGSVIYRGGTEDQAREFVAKLYEHVLSLGQGARNSSNTFTEGKEGDVQLTWENEALREVRESRGELDLVYPPVSIRAEPSVAVVDRNVAHHHSAEAAAAYLQYLFGEEAQEIFAEQGYRPFNPEILKKHQDSLPPIDLFPISVVAKDWNEAQVRFFGENGIFTAIHSAYKP